MTNSSWNAMHYYAPQITMAKNLSRNFQAMAVWSIDMNPPFRGPHTVSPIKYDTVPNFGKTALPRTYAYIVDEAGGGADVKPCTNGIRSATYMLDITTETKPMVMSVWQVPVGNFCEKGGRLGPHQSAETVNGKINRFTDKIAWLAYFNAGAQGGRSQRSLASRSSAITSRNQTRTRIRSPKDNTSQFK